MREIDTGLIADAVSEMAQETNYGLPCDVIDRIVQCREEETSAVGKNILGRIEENIRIAGDEKIPLCQDTGMACVFLEIGQDVHLIGESLYEAVNRGVAKGYKDGYLRKSIVRDPLRRVNTNDNTPADIHVDIVDGDRVRVLFAPKGFGSENMSRVQMFAPSAGEEGFKDFVVDTVRKAGGNPCPPVVVGIGLGSSFDRVTFLAKKALLSGMKEKNPDPFYARIEDELLGRINDLDIGPQGFGGKTTALAVHIIAEPTHIAGMPCAVNINCHVSRHAERIL